MSMGVPVLNKEEIKALNRLKNLTHGAIANTNDIMNLIYGEDSMLMEDDQTSLKQLIGKVGLSGFEVVLNGEYFKKFEVGDWVVYEFTHKWEKVKLVGKVTYISTNFKLAKMECERGIVTCELTDLRFASEEEIRTEKEKQQWSKWGRKLNEFKPYDIVKYHHGEFYVVHMVSGNVLQLDATDDYIEPFEVLMTEVEMSCLAEDRKDIEM